jgi:hypothetical protein
LEIRALEIGYSKVEIRNWKLDIKALEINKSFNAEGRRQGYSALTAGGRRGKPEVGFT